MYNYIMPEEALGIISASFADQTAHETVALNEAVGRVLSCDIIADEYVPSFNRSAMDGYAVIAADTVGCSAENPYILKLQGEVLMGDRCEEPIQAGYCVYVPTGAHMPDGADSVVMIEYAEVVGDGTIKIFKEVSPGLHFVSKGDDVYPGKVVLPAGRRIKSSDIGALAAMGIINVPVMAQPVIGIISTGDELVTRDERPADGQIRDVNSVTMHVLIKEAGGIPKFYGIVRDDEDALSDAMMKAVSECDVVLLSGGSSVGLKDATDKIISKYGEIIIQGIQAKPGKPTIVGKINGKPVLGLPGHPVSSFFNTEIFVKHIIRNMLGTSKDEYVVMAQSTEDVSPYKGRTAFVGVKLVFSGETLTAIPLPANSATISTLAGADGWIVIPKGSATIPAGEIIEVHLLGM